MILKKCRLENIPENTFLLNFLNFKKDSKSNANNCLGL